MMTAKTRTAITKIENSEIGMFPPGGFSAFARRWRDLTTQSPYSAENSAASTVPRVGRDRRPLLPWDPEPWGWPGSGFRGGVEAFLPKKLDVALAGARLGGQGRNDRLMRFRTIDGTVFAWA